MKFSLLIPMKKFAALGVFLLCFVLTGLSQNAHNAVTTEEPGNRQYVTIDKPELKRLVDSLQISLEVARLDVVPEQTSGNRVIGRVDKRALRITFEEMFEVLEIDEEIPANLNSRNVARILNLILAAALESPPSVQTIIASQIEDVIARLNGRVVSDGKAPLSYWGFKMGTDSTLSDSLVVPFDLIPVLDGDYAGFLDTSAVDTGAFYLNTLGLLPSTTHYYAAWAQNENGMAHGDTLSFLTMPGVTTLSATNVSGSTGTLNGRIAYGDVAPSVGGFRWGRNPNLLDADSNVVALAADSTISFDVTPEVFDTIYYVAFGTNDSGTRYGDTLSFVALSDPCFGLDQITYNGHSYPLTAIGTNCFFAENLQTTQFSDGSSLQQNLAGFAGFVQSGMTSAYDADDANVGSYGRVYDGYAVLSSKGLCPDTWVVPSKEEYVSLFEHLGGLEVAGDSLKASDSDDPAWDGANASGFSAAPGGYFRYGSFYQGGSAWEGLNAESRWWTRSTTSGQDSVHYFRLSGSSDAVVMDVTSKQHGYYVRCRFNAMPPEVVTEEPAGVTQSEAILMGTIEDNGGLGITAAGFVWGTTADLATPDTLFTTDTTATFENVLTSLSVGSTVYYAAFAKSDAGQAFGDTLSFSIDPFVPASFENCGDEMAFDGYNYKTVDIEGQCWFAENLRSSVFSDDAEIAGGLDSTAWSDASASARSLYLEGQPEETENLARYGRLYNSYAVSSLLLCPLGWHVPTDSEWDLLSTSLGGSALAGKKLKASAQDAVGWNGTNASGFTALPGGSRGAGESDFSGAGDIGIWWTSTTELNLETYALEAIQYGVSTENDSLVRLSSDSLALGASVRCVLNQRPRTRTLAANNIELTSATIKGEIVSDGGFEVTDFGFVLGATEDLSDGVEVGANMDGQFFTADLEALIAGTTYYYQSYATNQNGTAYGDTLNFLYTAECDGFTLDDEWYAGVEWGDQCWTERNLIALVYNDGEPIPTDLTNEEWVLTTEGAVATSSTASSAYSGVEWLGRNYNWYAVSSGRLCPSGWRVPTDEDWEILAENKGGYAFAGAKLKATLITSPFWDGVGFEGGFSPAGYRDGTDGNFYGVGEEDGVYGWKSTVADSALVWSSTANGPTQAWSFNMRRGSSRLERRAENIKHGGTVRCIKGNEAIGDLPSVNSAAATEVNAQGATLQGELTSNGGLDITRIGFKWSLSPELNDAATLLVSDTSGVFEGALTGLTPGFTYYYQAFARNAKGDAYGDTLSFFAMDCEAVTFGGHTYNVEAVADQCWFAENLQTAVYNDNEAIPSSFADAEWVADSLGSSAIYGAGGADEAANLADYGRLYNGFAVTSGKLCPSGWHVPGREAWEALFARLAPDGDEALMLKASDSDVPAWDGVNAIGFGALPGGVRDATSGTFEGLGTVGQWWSQTETGTGELWSSAFSSGENSAVGSGALLNAGLSVRCLQDSVVIPPVLGAVSAAAVSGESMVLQVHVENDGGEALSEVGFVWGLNEDLSDGSVLSGEAAEGSAGDYAADLGNLTAETYYYFSAYATNSAGTTFSDTIRRFAMDCEPVEYQGHVYTVTPLGEDCWFAENLRAVAYNNGDTIPSGLSFANWSMQTEGACSILNEGGDEADANLDHYGRLYNGHAMATNQLCPVGWHVSTKEEWGDVIDLISPPNGFAPQSVRSAVVGDDLKASTADAPGWDGTNAFGFSALAGGWRSAYGEFGYEGSFGFWWAAGSTDQDFDFGYQIATAHPGLNFEGVAPSVEGRSIRCVKGDNTVVKVPRVRTGNALDIRATSAILEGTVLDDGGGEIIERGFNWGLSPDLSDGVDVVSEDTLLTFATQLNDLDPETTYYYRAYVVNDLIRKDGEIRSFQYVPCESEVVMDGYTYHVVELGSKCWFVENLRTLVYNDGDSLRHNLSDNQWRWTNKGATAIYDEGFDLLDTTGMMLDTLYRTPILDSTVTPIDTVGWSLDTLQLQLHMDSLQFVMDSLQVEQDSLYLTKYGRLYNGFAVQSGKLCPSGWHVGTVDEWYDMTTEFVGDPEADNPSLFIDVTMPLKSSETDDPAWDGDNTLGFSMLPSGRRFSDGEFAWGPDYGWSYADYWTPYGPIEIDGFQVPYRFFGFSDDLSFQVSNSLILVEVISDGVVEYVQTLDLAWYNWSHVRTGKSVRCVRD